MPINYFLTLPRHLIKIPSEGFSWKSDGKALEANGIASRR